MEGVACGIVDGDLANGCGGGYLNRGDVAELLNGNSGTNPLAKSPGCTKPSSDSGERTPREAGVHMSTSVSHAELNACLREATHTIAV